MRSTRSRRNRDGHDASHARRTDAVANEGRYRDRRLARTAGTGSALAAPRSRRLPS
jgi:hypothetical protein